jgi:hypothetical protein
MLGADHRGGISVLSFNVTCDRSDRSPAGRPSARTKRYMHAAALSDATASRLGRWAGRQAPMGRKER